MHFPIEKIYEERLVTLDRKSQWIFINDFFYLGDKQWLGPNNMMFFCLEKL